MRYRTFGSLGWRVSEIGMGTGSIGGNWGPTDCDEVRRAILRAYDLGVNFFDAADVYGFGKAESMLARVFAEKTPRDKVYIASKGGRDFYTNPRNISRNFQTNYLETALDQSLKRLMTDSIDLYQLHGPSLEIIERGDIFQFLEKAKQSGKIRGTGLSLHTLGEVKATLRYGVVDCIQFPLNMVSSGESFGVLRSCRKASVALIAREPLARGLLTGRYKLHSSFGPDDVHSKWSSKDRFEILHTVDKLKVLSTERRSLAQVAIQFVLSHPEVTVVIPGARNSVQVEENATANETDTLSEDDLRLIRSTLSMNLS